MLSCREGRQQVKLIAAEQGLPRSWDLGPADGSKFFRIHCEARMHAQSLSCVRLFATLWTVAHQVSLSMGFSRQEYRSRLPFPMPGDHPDPGTKPIYPALIGGFLTTVKLLGSPRLGVYFSLFLHPYLAQYLVWEGVTHLYWTHFLKDYFLTRTIFKIFIEFVTILLLFYVLVFWHWGMCDLSPKTRDQTHTPCVGRWSLTHWTAREVPEYIF